MNVFCCLRGEGREGEWRGKEGREGEGRLVACKSCEHWNTAKLEWLILIYDYLSDKDWKHSSNPFSFLSSLENCPDNSSWNIYSYCKQKFRIASVASKEILWFEIYWTGNKTSHLISPLWHLNRFQMTSRWQQSLFGSNSCLIKGIKFIKKKKIKKLHVHKYYQSAQWCSRMSQCPLSFIRLRVLPSGTLKSFQTKREEIFCW